MKVVKIIVALVLIALIGAGVAFLIDLDRMNNNQEVIFSTWGRNYTPITNDNNENTNNENEAPEQTTTGMKIVVSLEDKISDDTTWCGTFNLIWNDLKNDLAKQDIVFTPQLDIVRNLNKGTFTTSQLSESSYYKAYGRPTLEFKNQIEKAIKEKFDETSDILDEFEWTEDSETNDYFLYTMLKKKFEFLKEFTKLEDGKFGDYDNVKYFGINSSTSEEVRDQIHVLYYNSKDDFAVQIDTKQNDEVIVAKGRNEDNFGDMYQEILKQKESYKGKSTLKDGETFKMPNMKINLKEHIKEVENKPFQFSDGREYCIDIAMQTIKFELDEKGGQIVSEAGMGVELTSSIDPEPVREFSVDNTFTMFLKEEGKDLPYFAAKISNIKNVQPEK